MLKRLVEEATVETAVKAETMSAEVSQTVAEGERGAVGEQWGTVADDGAVADTVSQESTMTQTVTVAVMNQRSGVRDVGGGVGDGLHGDQRSVGVVVGDGSWGVQQSWHSRSDGDEGGESLKGNR